LTGLRSIAASGPPGRDGRRDHGEVKATATRRASDRALAADLDRWWFGDVGLVALLAAGVHLVVATRYGWHRDEFYYVATGRRLAWGYPDQPPLTPLVARFAAAFGHGVLPLRIIVVGVQAGVIMTTSLLAREFGGARFAQVLAAGCAAGCAVFVGASLFLGTTPIDQLLWTVLVLLVLVSMRTGRVRWWLASGVVAGVGLEDKHTVAVLLLGIVVGLAVFRREELARAGPWLAALIAAAMWLPNLVWDAQHHWITLDMARALADDQGGIGGALSQVPVLVLVLPGPLIVYLWLRGAKWVTVGDGTAHRWVLVAAAVVTAAVVIGGGKPYYPAPLLAPLFALGAVATERRWSEGSTPRRRASVLVATSAFVAPLVGLAVLPPAMVGALGPLDREPMETYGWQSVAAQVTYQARRHPGAVAVYAGNYGEVGALVTYGPDLGLRPPVVAGQNAYGLWGPPHGRPTEVIAVGQFSASWLHESWGDVVELAPIRLPGGLDNQETENDAAIYLCRRPRGSWADLWPTLSYLN